MQHRHGTRFDLDQVWMKNSQGQWLGPSGKGPSLEVGAWGEGFLFVLTLKRRARAVRLAWLRRISGGAQSCVGVADRDAN